MNKITRQQKISDIIKDLGTLKGGIKPDQLYAINENIRFFEASRGIFSYVKWLFGRARILDGSRLLEINDLLPKYDEAMHRKLIEMEAKKFPGLIKLLVDKLLELILESRRDIVVADFGSGGMEAERQIITELCKRNYNHKVVFIGIDQSVSAHRVAKDNLRSLGGKIRTVEVEELDQAQLEGLKQGSAPYTVVHCRNDLFDLGRLFGKEAFDISFHTLFKHHLTEPQQEKLDQVSHHVSKKVLEYDGFFDFIGMIPQTFIGWNNPVFLNAEIFSNIRYLGKDKVKRNKGGKIIGMSKIGCYLSVEK
jgi:hypothetical protein